MVTIKTRDKRGVGREYNIDGRKFISVSSAIGLVVDKSFLDAIGEEWNKTHEMTWEQKNADIMLMGTYVHYNLGAQLAKENNLPIPEFEPERPIPDYKMEDFHVAMSYWRDFYRICRPMVHEDGIEKPVWSEKGYAGRLDAILKLDAKGIQDRMSLWANNFRFITVPRPNDVWVVDFKTSKAIWDGYEAQVQMYFDAYNEQHPETPANRMAILRVAPDGWKFFETLGDPRVVREALEAAGRLGYS